MSVQCPCKIEFTPDGGDPVTLVDVGGWLAALPRWSPDQSLYEQDGILRANGYFRPIAGVSLTLEFATEDEPANHLAALEAFAAPEIVDGDSVIGAAGTLTITTGTQVAVSAAVVASIKPSMPTGALTLTRAWSIRATLPTLTPI